MWLWSHNAHIRRYTATELHHKLTQTGFTPRRTSYNNFFVFPMAAVILLRRGAKTEPELASHHLDDDEYQVEMEPASPPVNTVLTLVGQVEAGLVRYVDLPLGTSLIAVGRRGVGWPNLMTSAGTSIMITSQFMMGDKNHDGHHTYV